jgi:hypothetical protein
LATNSRATLLEPEPLELERDARLRERADGLLLPEAIGASDERPEVDAPQPGAQAPQQGAPIGDSAPEHVGYHWLHAILWPIATVPAPSCEGKWRSAYREIGERPADERERVAACVRAELIAGHLKPRMCHPRHISDHWLYYLAGEPPRGKGAIAKAEQPTQPIAATRAEFVAAAERLPAWMNEAAS